MSKRGGKKSRTIYLSTYSVLPVNEKVHKNPEKCGKTRHMKKMVKLKHPPDISYNIFNNNIIQE